MTVSERFDAFLAKLKLTALQRADGETKFKSVVACLNRHYYGTASDFDHGKLVGSWGKRTEIRPPRDVDMMFMLPETVYLRFERLVRTTNKQSVLLQEVKGVLQSRFPRTTMKGDGQVVIVPFDSYSAELVPAFIISRQINICDTNNGGRYKIINPDAEMAVIDQTDRVTSGKARDLTRMMKRWQVTCNVPFSSFWFEILINQFLPSWAYRDKSTFYYDYMVRDFFEFLISKANGLIMVPGISEVITIGDAWKSRAQSGFDRSKLACSLEHSKPNEAGEEWRKIFGNDMPAL